MKLEPRRLESAMLLITETNKPYTQISCIGFINNK